MSAPLLTADDVDEVFYSGQLVEALGPVSHITKRQVAAVLEALQTRAKHIAERAWDEGYNQCAADCGHYQYQTKPTNPYTPLSPAAWECDNYRPPLTCLTAPSSETGRCDRCKTTPLSPGNGDTP